LASIAHDQAAALNGGERASGQGGRAAWAALVILALVNVLNYLDRHIVSILAESIKADLKLDDAQLGFLLGTAFAVFYSIVGIAMGGIADRLSRKKVLAFGLALWSAMTALGGAANSFLVLSVARIGVGVGEATANPCSQSLAADLIPPRRRALAMAVLMAGVFIGSALALAVGGWFVEHWNDTCTAIPLAFACDIAPWQAALFAVGLPGIPLALVVLAIREPVRPRNLGRSSVTVVLTEFAAALPPFTFFTVTRLGGRRGLTVNILFALGLAAAAVLLIVLTGDTAQWASLALGAYAVLTWGQVQSYRDKPLFALTFGDRTYVYGISASALVACIGGAVSTWAAPYAMRTFSLGPTELGASLGGLHTIGDLIGVLLGGWATDRIKQHDLRAPLITTAASLTGIVALVPVMLFVASIEMFLAVYFVLTIATALWSGAIAAMIQDLVIARMRGSAAAAFSLVSIVVASGLGPYWAGKVSAVAGSLTTGMLSLLLLALPAALLLWLAARRLPAETPEARATLARSAGEPAE
jgi:MFS family permease